MFSFCYNYFSSKLSCSSPEKPAFATLLVVCIVQEHQWHVIQNSWGASSCLRASASQTCSGAREVCSPVVSPQQCQKADCKEKVLQYCREKPKAATLNREKQIFMSCYPLYYHHSPAPGEGVRMDAHCPAY